jgi:hypothetical protein
LEIEQSNFPNHFLVKEIKEEKMKKLWIIVLCIIVLSACGSSPTSIPTSIPTFTPIPTQTPYPTYTPQATQTFTPQPTKTVPIDTRIVDDNPRNFILTKADLPKAADYIIPNELWSSPLTNDEVIQYLGVDEGTKYLKNSGRVTGWEAGLKRRSKGVGAEYPYELVFTIHQFKTIEGAKYPFLQILPDQGFQKISLPSEDLAMIHESTYEGEENTFFAGYTVDTLNLDVQHRNMLVEISLAGFEGTGQVTQDFAIDMAMKIISKIDEAELHPEWVE